ncbi:hypothetical protein ABZ208_10755 [Streptomyces sp. NPDC006208]|uniref:hypothetical protein n=1 Tax=Streptomyces sp. NPDC006208 TaxID=3156734 RepID=UPI0033B198D9
MNHSLQLLGRLLAAEQRDEARTVAVEALHRLVEDAPAQEQEPRPARRAAGRSQTRRRISPRTR